VLAKEELQREWSGGKRVNWVLKLGTLDGVKASGHPGHTFGAAPAASPLAHARRCPKVDTAMPHDISAHGFAL